MKQYLFIIIILFGTASASTSGQNFKYRIWLTDKNGCNYSTERPEEFLSQESIQRRNRQNIPIEYNDLPVCEQYITEIAAHGGIPVVKSRWMNTVVIALDDTSVLPTIQALPFVEKTECVWKKNGTYSILSRKKQAARQSSCNSYEESDYGKSYTQITLNGIDSLHRLGYHGENITIAILDAGFYNVDNNPTISPEQIAGSYDFPHGTFTYSGDYHGAMVLSCMLSNDPQNYIGSAPQARYWLIVTEDVDSEYPVEEDYWVAGAELADSIGADIINSSLGYNYFDDASMNYSWDDLDGVTAFCSRGATIAASKGMLVVTAAGNEGNNQWKKIIAPGDAFNVLTVGAVYPDNRQRTSFSSIGFTADGRIKPDVMATGYLARMIINGHTVISSQGTSFATPILCGGMACLWQARPEWKVSELIEAVQQSGSRADTPDAYLGYGIPNLYKALNYHSNTPVATRHKPLSVTYASTGNLNLLQPAVRDTHISIYNTSGQEVYSSVIRQGNTHIGYTPISGIYFILLDNGQQRHVQKIRITQ